MKENLWNTHILVDRKLLQAVQCYQEAHGLKSRAEAIRRLLRTGLAMREVLQSHEAVNRIGILLDKIENEPMATGSLSEAAQLGRLQVVDEVRRAMEGDSIATEKNADG